jgi:S1-C subfamily serine protease
MVTVFRSSEHFRHDVVQTPRASARSHSRVLIALLLLVACGVGAPARQTVRPATAASALATTQTQARRPAKAQAAAVATQATAAAPPVVAVMHRVSGWKLRAMVTPPDAPIATTFDENFVRTNIVAGYILSDGRTVVARLPDAEANVLNFASLFPDFKPPVNGGDSTLQLVRADGTQFDARFVGLDGSTGLTLIESSQPLLPPAKENAQLLSTGLRVCVWAPLPAEAPAPARTTTVPRPGAGVTVGDEGTLYMNLGEVDGVLRAVKRSPAGRTVGFRVEARNVSPEWSGGVALSETGALVGIVEQNEQGEAQLLPAETVRGAAARVKARRASVPQPWLGARGDAVASLPPAFFVERGWTREQASTLVRRQHGVLLTSVAPGTPAALAGLRPGDVVARVGDADVRDVEDMTWKLKELGGNVPAQFTVLRQGNMMNMRVMLSEAQNPAAETAQAEVYAAQTELARVQTDAERARADMIKLQTELERLRETDPATTRANRLPGASAETQVALREKLRAAEERYKQTSYHAVSKQMMLAEAQARLRAASASLPTFAVRPLLTFGIETAAFVSTRVINDVTETHKGLMIVAVYPESVAGRADLRVGDLIETVDDQPSLDMDWKKKLLAAQPEVTFGVLRGGNKLAVKVHPPAAPPK